MINFTVLLEQIITKSFLFVSQFTTEEPGEK